MASQIPDDDSNPGKIHYDKGQIHSDEEFNDLKKAETEGTTGDTDKSKSASQESTNTDKVKNAEENPAGSWANKVGADKKTSSKPTLSRPAKYKGKKFRGKGPIAFILILLLGGGAYLTVLFSPALLIINFKEVLARKFNTQHATMNVRTTKILRSKMTSGSCGKIPILCKYQSMSAKQIANFELNDIKVTASGTTMTGRYRVTGLEYEGKPIAPTELIDEMDKNIKFRSAVKKAYSELFAGFSDRSAKAAFSFLKLSKIFKGTPAFKGDTFDEKMKSMNSEIADATAPKKAPVPDSKSIVPGSDPPQTYEQLYKTPDGKFDSARFNAEKAAITSLNDIVGEFGGAAGESTAAKVVDGATEVADIFKLPVIDVLDIACTIYRAYMAVGYAAKAFRVLQLSYYADNFLKLADQTKAGKALDVDVSFLGRILTTESLDDDGKSKSATDSFGYQYAAFGDIGKMPTSASRFTAANGYTGALQGIYKFLKSESGHINSTCKIVSNFFVQFAGLIAGVVLAIFSGGFSIAAKITVKKIFLAAWQVAKDPWFIGGAGAGLAEIFLPNLLKDIVAGTVVDGKTVGADAGDAITSGASGLMGTTARFGGNAPISPKRATGISNLMKQVAAEDAEEDRLAYSPFDITNGNTFMGKITAQLIPYASKMSSLSGIINSITSVTAKSFASAVSPKTRAASEDEFTMCQDEDYREVFDIATDPYCNIYYGVDYDDLTSTTPVSVAESLLGLSDGFAYGENPTYGKDGPDQQWVKPGQTLTPETIPLIDQNGVPSPTYKLFINNCINRQIPLAESTDDWYTKYDQDPDGRYGGAGSSDCIYNNDAPKELPSNSWRGGGIDCGVERAPGRSPGFGYMFLTAWLTKVHSPTDSDCSDWVYTRHYYYISNAYLYMYYIDQRVECGMDEDMPGCPLTLTAASA